MNTLCHQGSCVLKIKNKLVNPFGKGQQDKEKPSDSSLKLDWAIHVRIDHRLNQVNYLFFISQDMIYLKKYVNTIFLDEFYRGSGFKYSFYVKKEKIDDTKSRTNVQDSRVSCEVI